MDLLELINSRHSYRGKFESTPVPREDLVKIMEAGLAAPSGCNKQTTSLVAVDDPALLEKLHGVIDPPIGTTAPAMICGISTGNWRQRPANWSTGSRWSPCASG